MDRNDAHQRRGGGVRRGAGGSRAMTEPFEPILLFVQMKPPKCEFLHAYEGNKWRPLPETVEIETQSATNHDIDFEIRVDENLLVELPCGSRPWWFRVERVGKNGSRPERSAFSPSVAANLHGA